MMPTSNQLDSGVGVGGAGKDNKKDVRFHRYGTGKIERKKTELLESHSATK